MTPIDTFTEAEALVEEFGPRPPGSDAERRAAQHLVSRLEGMGREATMEPFPVWPAWPLGYALTAGLAIVGSVLAVSSPILGTALVLVATVLAFLDLSGVSPTTRRLLGRRASQNVVSWGEREKPGALVLVANYDTGPARRVPLRPFFWAFLLILACCILRAAGLSGTFLTVLQFIPTVALIIYVPLLLDISLSKATDTGNAAGVALALRLADGAQLEHFGVHVVLTGSRHAMAQGMRAFLKRHRDQFARDSSAVVNLDALGSGELRHTTKEGPLVSVRSHPQLVALAEDDDVEDFKNRAPSDGYAAASAGLPSITIAGAGDERLDEQDLAAAERYCTELLARLDEEIGAQL